jgi:putative tricarboxylic transport membrane protein
MRVAEIVTASVLALVGGIVVLDALRLGIGWGTDGPRSGFFPFWLSIALLACALILLVQALRRAAGAVFVTRAQLGPVLTVLWPATAMVLLTQLIGLYAASGLYLGFYMRRVGHHGWGAVVALSLVVPVVLFLVFELWFLVPMPKGPLEAWLGY